MIKWPSFFEASSTDNEELELRNVGLNLICSTTRLLGRGWTRLFPTVCRWRVQQGRLRRLGLGGHEDEKHWDSAGRCGPGLRSTDSGPPSNEGRAPSGSTCDDSQRDSWLQGAYRWQWTGRQGPAWVPGQQSWWAE